MCIFLGVPYFGSPQTKEYLVRTRRSLRFQSSSTVTRTMIVAAFAATALTACSGESADTKPTSTTAAPTTTSALVTTTTAAPVATTTAVSPVAPPPVATPAAAPAAVPAMMPDVVCMNLQDAQDTIQAAGVFFSRSADATGAGRRQVVDSNWIVVDQTPSAGSPFGEIEAVLSAVKIGEPSPC